MMTSAAALQASLKLFIIISISSHISCHNNETTETWNASIEAESLHEDDSDIYYIKPLHVDLLESRHANKNISAIPDNDEDNKGVGLKNNKNKNKNKRRKNPILNAALQVAATQGLNAMIDLYERVEPEILRKGQGN